MNFTPFANATYPSYRLNQQAAMAQLSQVLFDTEKVARRVAATIPHDPFASAVISHYFLLQIGTYRTEHFSDIDSKRAWARATETLLAAVAKIRADHRTDADFQRFLDANARHGQIHQGYAGDLRAGLSQIEIHLETARVDERKAFQYLRIAVAAVALVLLIFVILESCDVAGAWFLFFVLVGGCIATKSLYDAWIKVKEVKLNASSEKARLREKVELLDAYDADPYGARFMEQAQKDHPFLNIEPPPLPEGSQETSVRTYVERNLVERQIIVVRCKFCLQRTPVDQPTCQSCGAPGFGD